MSSKSCKGWRSKKSSKSAKSEAVSYSICVCVGLVGNGVGDCVGGGGVMPGGIGGYVGRRGALTVGTKVMSKPKVGVLSKR